VRAHPDPQTAGFLSRLRTDRSFAELVRTDPAAASAAAGLKPADVTLIVDAVARATKVVENAELVQRARAEVDTKGSGAFATTSTEDLVRLGRAARATTRLLVDRSDEELRGWGGVDEWRAGLSALRLAMADWPAVAATALAARPLPEDPELQHGVSVALQAFTDLAEIAST